MKVLVELTGDDITTSSSDVDRHAHGAYHCDLYHDSDHDGLCQHHDQSEHDLCRDHNLAGHCLWTVGLHQTETGPCVGTPLSLSPAPCQQQQEIRQTNVTHADYANTITMSQIYHMHSTYMNENTKINKIFDIITLNSKYRKKLTQGIQNNGVLTQFPYENYK